MCAIKFLTLLDKSNKFSLAMLVDKVTSSTRLVFNKNSSQAVSDGVHKWEICCFMVEMFTKYIGDKVMELVLQLNKVPSTPYNRPLYYLPCSPWQISYCHHQSPQ